MFVKYNKVRHNFSMKIGIDARFYGTKNKGLGRYTKEVVDKVIDLDQENEYVVFLRENILFSHTKKKLRTCHNTSSVGVPSPKKSERGGG